MSAMRDACARYAELGWSLVPIKPKGKEPLVDWKPAQRERADSIDFESWEKRFPDYGLGVVTGDVSNNLVVIDVDSEDADKSQYIQTLPVTAKVKTFKGHHYYFHYNQGLHVPRKIKFREGTDCLGNGGYAILPPSIHGKSGAPYVWEIDPESGIATIPPEKLESPFSLSDLNKTEYAEPATVQVGTRNENATSYVGHLMRLMDERLWVPVAWPSLIAWNLELPEPLEDDELGNVYCSIEKRELEKRVKVQTPHELFMSLGSLDFTQEAENEVLIPNLLWRGLFHLWYGRGKIGKTGAGAWVLADLSRKGYIVGVVNNEDRPQEFVRRYLASGGVFDNLRVFNDTKPLLILERDAEALVEYIKQENMAFVFFDSIMDHREPHLGENAAEVARYWAGAASTIARKANCGILGSAHENVNKKLEGAAMQINKSRSTVHITRDDNTQVVTLEVEAANRGPAGLKFIAHMELVESLHPITREPDMEYNAETGKRQPVIIPICKKIEMVPTKPYNVTNLPTRNNEDVVLQGRRDLIKWFNQNPGNMGLSKNQMRFDLGLPPRLLYRILDDPHFTKIKTKWIYKEN